MNRLPLIATALLVAGCSAEVATSAATAAAGRAQEAKQAQQNLENVRQRLDAATEAGQKNLDAAERANPY